MKAPIWHIRRDWNLYFSSISKAEQVTLSLGGLTLHAAVLHHINGCEKKKKRSGSVSSFNVHLCQGLAQTGQLLKYSTENASSCKKCVCSGVSTRLAAPAPGLLCQPG